MTPLEFAVTYAVCWWMVLFMLLPHQAQAPAEPGLGHAPSAPENPRLRRKFRRATLLAFIPAIFLCGVVNVAKAEEVIAGDPIYHASSSGGCKPRATYQASGDVDAKDGYSTGGKKVKAATLEGGSTFGNKESYDIPIRIPQAALAGHGADLSQSMAELGTLSVGKDGTTKLDGTALVSQETYGEDCDTDPEKPEKKE